MPNPERQRDPPHSFFSAILAIRREPLASSTVLISVTSPPISAQAGVLMVCCLTAACYSGGSGGADGGGSGGNDDGATAGSGSGGIEDPPANGGVGVVGMRRLSRWEMDNTLRDLLGDDTRPGTALLPEDALDPFDNDYAQQVVTTLMVESLESLAIDVANRLVADAGRRNTAVGCTPSGAADAACMESFVRSFGRRALRRGLNDAEVMGWVELALDYAGQSNDFYQGVDVVVRLLLQHPQFVYRVELGTPTEETGVYRLNDYEVATRLSYFVLGTTPTDDLLDLAESGGLGAPDDVSAAAQTLLADPRARERIDRFHAMWLGYYTLPHSPELTTAMRKETRALLDDVIFDNARSYFNVFQAPGTFANDLLAELYGLPAPGTDELVWVEYGATGRAGLLSHGSFLSVVPKFGDTSPTRRGKLVRNRLLCQSIPPPPPTVNVDSEPTSPVSECKVDRYAAHRTEGSCASCHELTDPIGFGLEQFDKDGSFRTVEADHPECQITGEGKIDGTDFTGPAELGNYIIENELLDTCLVAQVYRFAMGHEAGDDDMRYVDDLRSAFVADDHRFDRLVLSLAGDEAFGYRREEQ